MPIPGLLLSICALVSGLTSVPLTYYAVRSHREVRRLHGANRSLRRELAAPSSARRVPRPHGRHVPSVRPHRRLPAVTAVPGTLPGGGAQAVSAKR